MLSETASSSNSSPQQQNEVISIELTEVLRRKRLLIEHEQGAILLLATQSGIVALDPTCPHQHVRSLCEGTIEGDTITCPNHGWQFRLSTGEALCGSGRLRCYAVHVADGMVHVSISTTLPRWMRD
ncbi:MAG: hypothetical protein KatS3mg039_0432 [Candidatus Kapaibacterium sp.]|nr:MAG: hypothetical protein KatS3mg039_0432 [Candidatus Kapabacteria bacterium]